MTRLFLLLFPLLLLLLAACDDDLPTPEPEPETALEALDRLVPATQEGANKIGCLIDGKVWENKGGSAFDSNVFGSFYIDSSRVTIGGFRRSTNSGDHWSEIVRIPFIVANHSPILPVIYDMTTTNSVLSSQFGSPRYYGDYFLLDSTENIVVVEFWNSEIISGTFQCHVKQKYTGEVLEVTNGRFDVTYQTF